MGTLITWQRLARLGGFASTQLAVQVIGFVAGILLVRHMAQAEYGYYTLAVSMTSMAVIFTDLGLATAVLAIGGRYASERNALGAVAADAISLHRKLAWWGFSLLAPCFAVLLMRQGASAWQVGGLVVMALVSAGLGVRSAVALQVTRVLGHTGVQQRVDLGVNLTRLAALGLAAWSVLDAMVACLVNLAAAVATLFLLRRHLDRQVEAPVTSAVDHRAALRRHVWKQAPNSVYYVFSSQLAVWLIGVFGSAERVAEVGALSRLGALFTVIIAVSSALVLPYFAKREGRAELWAGFVSVNVFYAALLAALVAMAVAFPSTVLWVLGGGYGALQSELVWMVLASTLATWGGTVYSIGCARGWVQPIGLTVATGVLATVGAALLVDVATVRGSFMITAAGGLASTIVAMAYFAWQLRQHHRPSALGGAATPASP